MSNNKNKTNKENKKPVTNTEEKEKSEKKASNKSSDSKSKKSSNKSGKDKTKPAEKQSAQKKDTDDVVGANVISYDQMEELIIDEAYFDDNNENHVLDDDSFGAAFVHLLQASPFTIQDDEDAGMDFIIHWDICRCDVEYIKDRKTLAEIRRRMKGAERVTYKTDGIVVSCTISSPSKDANIVEVLKDDFTPAARYLLDTLVTHICCDYYGRPFNTVSFGALKALSKACLCAIHNSCENAMMINPSIEFVKDVRAGKFTDISDIDYKKILMDYRNMNTLFRNNKTESALTILGRIIAGTLSSEGVDKISDIIADNGAGRLFIGPSDECPECDNDAPGGESEFSYTPKDIFNYLSESVVHQDAAKKSAAMLVYNHIREHGRNIIMAGPTGCGKTEIWRTLSKKFPYIKIISGPQLTAEGWKGGTKLADLFVPEGSRASRLILVIDEADKIFEPMIGAAGTDHSKVIQNELLKIMDHADNNIVTLSTEDKRSVNLDTSKLSVVLCGSFERMLEEKNNKPSIIGFLEEQKKLAADGNYKYTACDCTEQDLIDYANMRTELAGRINQIVTLEEMTADDFETIITHKTASPVKKLEKELDINININKKAKKALAKKAADSKLGCRIIRSKLLSCIDNLMFDEPEKKDYDISQPIIEMLET